MRFGLVLSILFHLCIVGAIVVWGADFSDYRAVSDNSIPIELISEAQLADTTNVPAFTTEPVDEPVATIIPDDPVAITPEPVKISEPEVIASVAPPPPEKIEVPKKEEPKIEEKKPDPSKEKPKPKKKDVVSTLDELSKRADEASKKQKERAPNAQAGPVDTQGTGATKLTASETARFRAHMKPCWSVNDGAPNPEKLVVSLSIRLNPDGSLQGPPKVLNERQIISSRNAFWRAARDEALRAVVQCQPYDFLSPQQYREEFNINFNPTDFS